MTPTLAALEPALDDLRTEHGPFKLTRIGARATRPATYDEWETALGWAQAVQKASPFWVGDLINYGEHCGYGEKYKEAQALDTGVTYGTLRMRHLWRNPSLCHDGANNSPSPITRKSPR